MFKREPSKIILKDESISIGKVLCKVFSNHLNISIKNSKCSLSLNFPKEFRLVEGNQYIIALNENYIVKEAHEEQIFSYRDFIFDDSLKLNFRGYDFISCIIAIDYISSKDISIEVTAKLKSGEEPFNSYFLLNPIMEFPSEESESNFKYNTLENSISTLKDKKTVTQPSYSKPYDELKLEDFKLSKLWVFNLEQESDSEQDESWVTPLTIEDIPKEDFITVVEVSAYTDNERYPGIANVMVSKDFKELQIYSMDIAIRYNDFISIEEYMLKFGYKIKVKVLDKEYQVIGENYFSLPIRALII
ncbi:hypothetical protein ACTHAL_003663 [Priestia flexa]|uniref:Uncharacterized protein n=1 Tax=Priestia veravalensis TaxID=1414648 RepID=A0A0V8JGH1_9BACI|nr:MULTISPECIES: hypothetical protein [Priestia]KSU86174.1 hypothetical protein AS180_20110 [Priestia veravalensis]SCC56721.1 hypothetical protein GA0061087_10969 [Priestia flexa]